MSGFCRCRAVFPVVCFALFEFMAMPIVFGDDAASEGIDFVLLVDVSRSMIQSNNEVSKTNNKKDGSDYDRIRWDAAKLLLDLLGPGDRLMVCRFNHGCPPILNKGEEMQDDETLVEYFKKNPKDFMDAWRSDFKKEFQQLPKDREGLAVDINKFNRTDDDIVSVGYLDAGGTRIVGALSSVATRLKTAVDANPDLSTRRPVHVIVLTDGLDQDYGPEMKNYADDSVLRKAMASYTGDPQAAIRPGVRIPVHCIGLNLAGEGEEKAKQARHLLGRISHMSGGTYQEIGDNGGLMTFFLCLTKNLRRHWIEEIKDPQERIHHTLVTNGLAELGILSFRETGKKSRKYALEPTKAEPKLEWVGLEKRPESDPVRMGKGGTLYRYYYFGRTVNSVGDLESSPFSKFAGPVTLNIEVPRESDQRLVLLKGTVEPLFELVTPKVDSHYRRYQKLAIQVAMLSTEHFVPENFELNAIVRPLGAKSRGDANGGRAGVSCAALTSTAFEQGDDEIRGIRLRPEKLENGKIVFSGELPLSSLPRTAELTDYYEVTVTARGLGGRHALSNMQQELPPRIFTVENSLQLEAVDAIELSTDPGGDVREFEIQAATGGDGKPLKFGDIPLKLEFRTPQSKKNGTSLDGKHFEIKTPQGPPPQLVLKDGRATIRVSLTQVPERGLQYLPGEFVVTHADGVRMDPLRIPLKLRLDLAKVQFKSVPAEIVAKSELVSSDPITVVLDPKGVVRGSDKDVTVTLKFLGPVDKTKPDPSVFDETELWLEKSGGKVDPKQPRTIQVKVGGPTAESFRIHLNPRGAKTPMKYRCRLEVDGDWIDAATHDFELNKDAAGIEVDPATISVAIGRGLSRRLSVKAWLNGGLRDEHADDVHVAGIQSGQSVFFTRKGTENKGDHFQIFCRDAALPVKLAVVPTELDFEITVPEDAPYGRYSHELTLVGTNVTSRKIPIVVVVNGLEFDVLGKGQGMPANSPELWQPVSTKPLIQLLNTRMKQTLRLRTGLGEPLEKDEIEVRVVGLFQDANGDPVQGRVGLSEFRFDDDRKTAQIDIEFPKTANRNEQGLPYKLHLVANAKPGTGGAKTSEKWFVKDATFEFQIRYLDKKEIVEVRLVPLEPKTKK